jgi:sRNA-binding carbon storage regulator CsrA
MLVTQRLIGQRHVITVPPSDKPTTIVHTVVELRAGGRVRCGWDAPREVIIHREEVQKRADAAKALTPTPPPLKPTVSVPPVDSYTPGRGVRRSA